MGYKLLTKAPRPSRAALFLNVCSDCGYRWGKLDLKEREIVCMNCGTLHDRDDNASKNIEQVGVGHTHDYKRTGRERKTSLEAAPAELSTHLKYEQLKLFDW
jgi:putative transposase